MLNIAHSSARAWLSPGRIGVQVRSFFAGLELALRVRSERQSLSELDERTLKDIGFNRGDAYAEIRSLVLGLARRPAARMIEDKTGAVGNRQ